MIWPEHDKQKLIAGWRGKSKEELKLMFPQYTYSAITSQAKRLKLGPKKKLTAKKQPAASDKRGLTMVVKARFYKPLNIARRPVRIDYKTIIYVPVTYTDKQVEAAVKLYTNHLKKIN